MGHSFKTKQSHALLPLKICNARHVVVLGVAHCLPNKKCRMPIYLRLGPVRWEACPQTEAGIMH